MTLVSIVGDFFSSVVPVFYYYKDEIDTHIIISDDSKRDDLYARKFFNGVENFTKQNNLNIKNFYYTIDEDSIESLTKAIEFMKKNQKGDLYLNITDGFATLNTIFSNKLLPSGAKVISYDRYDNEFHLISTQGIQKIKITNSPSIKEHFLLKDVKVCKTSKKDFALEYQDEIESLFKDHYKEYRSFIKYLSYKSKLPHKLDYPNMYKIFGLMDYWDSNLEHINFQPMTGDMYEYFTYLQIKDLDFDDIEIGVNIKDFVDNEWYENEFDILLMKDNHLHMIECKFKRYVDNISNLIYKYSSLKRFVDDDAKIIILSDMPQQKIKQVHKTRAFMNDIILLTRDNNLQQKVNDVLIKEKDFRKKLK